MCLRLNQPYVTLSAPPSKGSSEKLKQSQAVPQGGLVEQAPVLALDTTGAQSLPTPMDLVAHFNGQHPKQRHLLPQRGGPSIVGHWIHFLPFWE